MKCSYLLYTVNDWSRLVIWLARFNKQHPLLNRIGHLLALFMLRLVLYFAKQYRLLNSTGTKQDQSLTVVDK